MTTNELSDEQKALFENVQGNILKGFNKPNVRLVFFKFGDPKDARMWLSKIATRVTSTMTLIVASGKLELEMKKDPAYQPQEIFLHASLSYSGLRELGFAVPPSARIYKGHGTKTEIIKQPAPSEAAFAPTNFDDPFYEGMKARSAILGDIEINDPANWKEPYRSSQIDALLLISGDMEDDLDSYTSKLIAEATRQGIICVGLEIGKAIENEHGEQVEHFGFRDGVAHPLIVGIDDREIKERKINKDVFYPEDFLLHGLTHPKLEWANGGSFLVFRRLSQDVPGFWEFMELRCQDSYFQLELTPEELAARMMGRWKSGAPLAKNEYEPADPNFDSNDFLYRDTTFNDPDGQRTAKFAHIRIANPRDHQEGEQSPEDNWEQNLEHRILRRGVPYGPPWAKDMRRDVDRGLLFICYQRDILKQFEHIQRSFLNYDQTYAQTTGLHARILNMLRGEGGYSRLGIERWVTTTGGAYFFSPSIRALKNMHN
jgi:Dyp-type peroxidase family